MLTTPTHKLTHLAVTQILQVGIQQQITIRMRLDHQTTQQAQLQIILQTLQLHQKYHHHQLIHHLTRP